jgi:hypothetical protein
MLHHTTPYCATLCHVTLYLTAPHHTTPPHTLHPTLHCIKSYHTATHHYTPLTHLSSTPLTTPHHPQDATAPSLLEGQQGWGQHHIRVVEHERQCQICSKPYGLGAGFVGKREKYFHVGCAFQGRKESYHVILVLTSFPHSSSFKFLQVSILGLLHKNCKVFK